MAKRKTSMETNRTGAAVSPKHTKALREASAKMKQVSRNGHGIFELRCSYVDGGKIGSVPHPQTLKGLGKSLVDLLKGARAPTLMDRLSERLCSERAAVRLYEGLIAKYEAMGSWPGGPELHELEHLRSEELEHFHFLYRQMEAIGSDPTALTPSADVMGVALMGIPQVIADPRTDLRQCMEAMLLAELADNAFWESLGPLALHMGHEKMAKDFHDALAVESRHLSLMRSWVLTGQWSSAGLRPTEEKTRKQAKGNGRRKRAPKARTSRQPRAR